MGRAPCCAKMGLNRGPWTPEEDHILISYIRNHGHTNWRALPKLAGLLRCGKSCRLRWINYLNPDIKRGNFTREEEDSIISLHQLLGNKWSAIAAKLPGRTDNEIKNVWHTHLKKRLKQSNQDLIATQQLGLVQEEERGSVETGSQSCQSPQPSIGSADEGSIASPESSNHSQAQMSSSSSSWSPSMEDFPPIDESFWSESGEMVGEYLQIDTQLSTDFDFSVLDGEVNGDLAQRTDGATDFWYDLLVQAGGIEGF